MIKLQFFLRFNTRYGQSIWVTGNIKELGNNDITKAVALEYLDDEFWHGTLTIDDSSEHKSISYKYFLKNEDGEFVFEWGNDRTIPLHKKDFQEIHSVDTWNHAGEFENAFFTAPFDNVLLHANKSKGKADSDKNYTHIFRVKAPLLQKNEAVCILGGGRLGEWSTVKPILLEKKGNWWEVKLNLRDSNIPIAYKYGIYNTKEKNFLRYEEGDNRLIYPEISPLKLTILHDGFAHFPNNIWKGTGIAIPVFSLRSKNSFGVGEFSDLKLLADWANETNLKLIQILPINDTIATNTWLDSYPYAAISAFALHPLYINLTKVAGKENNSILTTIKKHQKTLNDLPEVDYEKVIKYKITVLKELYAITGKVLFETESYKTFLEEHKHWLQPYAAFCYFRDKYKTSHAEDWKTNSIYNKESIEKLFNSTSVAAREIGFYCFVQYHLHIQLKDAVDYAHKKGIVLKGDIPIGIYRFGCDAWVEPELYNMCWQAGAPPDDFTAIGQNWGFPTYNWKRMKEDNFSWWRKRFEQMSNYFDAFRIDHILGFFRIWSIPANAVQGIMGRFVPCLPVHINEFGENGIWFDYQRYCRPFINDAVLAEIFGEQGTAVKEKFMTPNNFGGFDLLPEYESQLLIENYFSTLENTEENVSLKGKLFDIVSNVILFEEPDSQGIEFHFRISMEKTTSFKYLDSSTQEKLKELSINYFFRRQDNFWFKEAMNRLPQLKAATNMLVCGEDLGMVPHCVPDVMQQLGLLSLEIQRMPKDPKKEFFHPNDAPYLSVITPSTHDMSTIRGWWEENRERTQQFYNYELGQWGVAPQYCEAWVNRAIILQHLYSPAMWSIFQLQDILGMSETLRRENPHHERINNPANPKNYWQYRMHISLEDLMKENEFNAEFSGYIQNCGRG